MNILITNDDGIDSPFLRPLAEVFSKRHNVIVAAPANEQSWIGKAMSRRGKVESSQVADFPCPAFSLTGTPSDCVNIALGYLCDTRPDIVVSGINIGHNAGLSFIASSGTIGAAMEGAFHNLPAIAASMYLNTIQFESVGKREQPLNKEMSAHVFQAAIILESFASTFISSCKPSYGQVHSLNFPCEDIETAKLIKVPAGRTLSRPLFERDGNQFRFAYKPLKTLTSDRISDRDVIHDGNISHTIIDFTSIDNASY